MNIRRAGILTTLVAAAIMLDTGPASAAPPIETMQLWNLQVRITTGDTPGAGTNGTPALRFNGSTSGVRTLNPPSPSAFDRNHIDTYDLRLRDLESPSQITMLRIGIPGTDDWCVKRVELFFNGRVAFADDPRSNNEPCFRIKAGDYIQYSSTKLRSHQAWTGYRPPALPLGLSAYALRKLVTGVTGSAMLATPGLSWDPAVPVRVTRVTSHSIHISFGTRRFDPSGIESPDTATVVYDVRLFVSADSTVHAAKTNALPMSTGAVVMSDAVVDQLDKALSRMTVRPRPHDPIRFGVDANTNIAWSYVPVIG